jgi:hypothetical protein
MIKTINHANPGVRRPLRVSDIQDLWNALKLVADIDSSSDTVILSGFDVDDEYNLTKGLVAKNGKIYYNNGTSIELDADVYGHELSGVDLRVFSDNSTSDFAFNCVANSTSSGGVFLGKFTEAFIKSRKIMYRKRSECFREVYGTLAITINELPMQPTVTFTPDSASDNDVTLTADTSSTKYIDIGLKDGKNQRMRPFISPAMVWLNALTIEAAPDFITVTPADATYDVRIVYLPDFTDNKYINTTTSYKIKLTFPL